METNLIGFNAAAAKLGLKTTEGQQVTATGYGIVFNQLSEPRVFNGKVVRYLFLPGSANPLPNVMARYQHDAGRPLGRTDNNTLRLSVDDYGVAFELDLPDTTDGRDTATLLARRDIVGASVAMTNAKAKLIDRDGIAVMEVSYFEYPEISVVDNGGFSGAVADIAPNQADTFTEAGVEAPKNLLNKKEYERVKGNLRLRGSTGQSIALPLDRKPPIKDKQ